MKRINYKHYYYGGTSPSALVLGVGPNLEIKGFLEYLRVKQSDVMNNFFHDIFFLASSDFGNKLGGKQIFLVKRKIKHTF